MRQYRHLVVALLFMAMLLASGCGSGSGTASGLSFTWKSYAHLTNTPTARPWVVLMCKYSDVSDEPAGLFQEAKEFLTPLGHLTGNMYDYFSDVSYGASTIAGSEVHGWYTAPYSFASQSTTFAKKYGNSARWARVQLCADQVPASDVAFSQFFGVIVVLNKVGDGGACGTNSVVEQHHQMACVLFDANSFFTAFGAQEMAHGYGLWHSGDQTGCQYCDPWDVMSTCNGTHGFQGTNYVGPNRSCINTNWPCCWDGPGLNAPNLLTMGWLPLSHTAVYAVGGPPQVVTLAALSHPEASGMLALRVTDGDPLELYTVEYRTPDGWDAGFPQAAVFLHAYEPGLPYQTVSSFLQKPNTYQGDGRLLSGMAWTGNSWNGPSMQWKVTVLSTGSTTATIRIEKPSLFATAPLVQILAPADGSHVTAGAQFQLAAKATTFDGHPLPASSVVWTVNGNHLGMGATLTTSIAAPGTYTIAVTGTDASQNNQSASSSITLVVDSPAPPPPAPTAQILSPTNGQGYRIPQFGSVQVVLSSSASSGVAKYAWSDSLHLITDTKPNDTVTIAQQQIGCVGKQDTISLTVTDSHGQTGTAEPVTINFYPQCIV
jgi:hypothetical protein